MAAIIADVIDALILLWLVGTEFYHARKKRVRAICPECLDEHDVEVVKKE